MAYVYVLRSLKDGRLYTGSTKDVVSRVHQHNSGENVSTKNRRPFVLVYSEELETVSLARQRELFFKTGHGRKFLQSVLDNAGIV